MSECEEWRQFQADLLMTVRVANDFQTEAQVGWSQDRKDQNCFFFCFQTNLEQISEETADLRDRIRQLEGRERPAEDVCSEQ